MDVCILGMYLSGHLHMLRLHYLGASALTLLTFVKFLREALSSCELVGVPLRKVAIKSSGTRLH